MTYIANRPVRFDRDYAIGEIIPESAIDPGMIAKLEGMGKIIKSDIPALKQAAKETVYMAAESPVDSDNEAEGTNIPTDKGNEPTEDESGENEGAEFKCDVCGKVFGSANALSAHSRVHKQ